MSVKPVRSATRVLAVLEAVGLHQPIGLAPLTRLLEEDKSAVQRALATLTEDGWIRAVAGDPPRFELTTRTLALASQAAARSDLRARARPVLESLRDETDESVMLAVPDAPRVVVLDVVESRQLVRAAPHVGMVIPPVDSAAGRALLAGLPSAEVERFVGAPPGEDLDRALAVVRERGWSHHCSGAASGIGASVRDGAGRVLGAVVLSAPTERLPASRHEALGRRLVAAAAGLSGD